MKLYYKHKDDIKLDDYVVSDNSLDDNVDCCYRVVVSNQHILNQHENECHYFSLMWIDY